MALTGFTRDLSHSLAYGPGTLFQLRMGPHSLLCLCCCCLQTIVCLLLFLACWLDFLDGCWTWLAILNLSGGHWTAGTTCYCQQLCPACHGQVPLDQPFLGEDSALLLVGWLWLLVHPPCGAAPLLEAFRDPEHTGRGSPTADRSLVSDHCHWMSAKGPLHTGLLNAEKNGW